MRKRTLVLLLVAAMLSVGLVGVASGAYGDVQVTFLTPKNAPDDYHFRMYTHIYVDGVDKGYIESSGFTGNPVTLHFGLHLVRYAMFPNNGAFGQTEIAHIDVWYNIPFDSTYEITVPISYVTFQFSRGSSNGWQGYAWSADKVEALQASSKPSVKNPGFAFGGSGYKDFSVGILAGTYTFAFQAKNSADPAQYFVLPDPVSIDGVNPVTVQVTVP